MGGPKSEAEGGAGSPSGGDDLATVMAVMRRVLDADAVVLTMHAAGGEPTLIAAVGAASGVPAAEGRTRALADAARARRIGWPEWHEDAAGGACLLVPLEEVPGHSRLVLGLHFDAPGAEQRARADAYVDRRPFADGYFELWQRSRLRAHRCAALEAALNRAGDGLILVSRSGDILFANDTAETILGAGDGLRRAQNALRATNLADSVNLQLTLEHVIAAATRGAEGEPAAQVISLARRAGGPLLALVVPGAHPPVQPSDVAAVIHVSGPEQGPGRTLVPVCQAYGLSPVETALVGHLAAGRTLNTAAQSMHIKEHTARSYLKNIFFKTSTNRQAEVVALVLGSLVHVTEGALKNVGFGGARRGGRLLV